MKSASAPPLMCCLKPLMTQESPSRTARVRMPPTSEPAVGSLMARAGVISAAPRGPRGPRLGALERVDPGGGLVRGRVELLDAHALDPTLTECSITLSLSGSAAPAPASAGLLRSVGLRPTPAVSGEHPSVQWESA